MSIQATTAATLSSPDAEAQALLEGYGPEAAQRIANEGVVCYAALTERTEAEGARYAFWQDVATLLRLETQSDEGE